VILNLHLQFLDFMIVLIFTIINKLNKNDQNDLHTFAFISHFLFLCINGLQIYLHYLINNIMVYYLSIFLHFMRIFILITYLINLIKMR
jgi:hypothetical protein